MNAAPGRPAVSRLPGIGGRGDRLSDDFYRKPQGVSPWRGRRRGIERLTSFAFCDKDSCPKMAAWRIGSENGSFHLCERHTVAAMKNQSIWS
jgi:hypothetical protein